MMGMVSDQSHLVKTYGQYPLDSQMPDIGVKRQKKDSMKN